jgi:hypothetical protein
MKSRQKGAKENKIEKGENELDRVAPDSPVPLTGRPMCTGESGARFTVQYWLLSKISACVGYNSLDRPCGALDSPVCQLANGRQVLERRPPAPLARLIYNVNMTCRKSGRAKFSSTKRRL